MAELVHQQSSLANVHLTDRVCTHDVKCSRVVSTHLLEVEVHHRDEVQRVCVVVVIWAAITVVHPQLDQAALTWHHVHCMSHSHMGPCALPASG